MPRTCGGGQNLNGEPSDANVDGNLNVQDSLTVGDDLVINGNLTVNGNQTVIDTEQLVVEDPMVVVGKDNQANLNDGGIIVEYDVGTSAKYAGLVRDKSNGNLWTLVDGLTSQPATTANNTVLYSNSLASLKGQTLIGEAKIICSSGRYERSNGLGFEIDSVG